MTTWWRLLAALSFVLVAPVAPARGAADPPGAPPSATAPSAPSATALHLAAAHESDLHARARYLAFADQADAEGLPRAARVFRAAARSEEIRAARHAEALRALGREPAPAPAPPVTPRGTRQNLMAMLAHENAERHSSYAQYAQQARRDGQAAAVLTFTEAHRVETELVKLYQETLATLGSSRGEDAPLHVCRDCGYVVRGAPPPRCPVSLSDGAAFAIVD